jgi:ribosomal protein S18 acetylase RimI-like enzyme
MKLTTRPLTPDRWPDLEAVFNAKGCSVARGCWCMYYRLSGAQPWPSAGSPRAKASHAAFRKIVDSGEPPGLIGYLGKEPVGWVALGPREDYPKLQRSPVMKPVDDQPVWSITCFVVPSAYRGQGVATALLAAAVAYAKKRGVRLLEGYPIDKAERSSSDSMWFGSKAMFDAAGFEEVARRKPTRPVVRIRPG